MNVISSALQAMGLFLVTNIDDIIVLSLFFARGAGQRGTATKIVVGQYLGFGGILLASVAVTFGAGLFLPDDAIPYFGLIPLLLGAFAAWQVWRNGDDDDDSTSAQSATDEASSRSNSARDMMEAFNPMQLLNAMGEMLMQVLGAALSG